MVKESIIFFICLCETGTERQTRVRGENRVPIQTVSSRLQLATNEAHRRLSAATDGRNADVRQRVYRRRINTPKTDHSYRPAALSEGLLAEMCPSAADTNRTPLLYQQPLLKF